MHRYFFRAMITMAAIALWGLVAFLGTTEVASAQNAPAAKKWKDQGEYDLYSAIGKDIGGKNFKQAIADLDSWKQKYAASDYDNERDALYVQAYANAGQPDKALEAAGSLIDKGLDTLFADPKTGPPQELTVLFTSVQAMTMVKNPTPQQLAIGEKAAKQLLAFNRKPEGVPDAAWEEARTKQLQPPAKATLLYIAMQPGAQAMAKNPKDCPGAEAAFGKALGEYPDSPAIAYNLGLAYVCEKKLSEAVYEFQRAVVLDASLGGTSDAKKIQTFADTSYSRLHGSDEGLDALKQTVKASAMPPAGFHIKTATEIAEEKEAEFEKSNPQLSMWMKLKAALSDANGEQYFTDSMKGADVPKLRGTLMDAKPACNPKELLVAVPLPDTKEPKTEISLKLDNALTGKPEANQTFQFKGVPSTFTKDPFLVTFDVEKDNVEGLSLAKCVPAAARPPAKKAPPAKKK